MTIKKSVKYSISLFFLIISSFLTQCSQKKFNSTDWKESNDLGQTISSDERMQMAEDLVKNRQLVGLNHTQMLSLLGEPQNDTASTWYRLKENYDMIDPVSGKDLIIKFNKDSLITSAEIKEWHKH